MFRTLVREQMNEWDPNIAPEISLSHPYSFLQAPSLFHGISETVTRPVGVMQAKILGCECGPSRRSVLAHQGRVIRHFIVEHSATVGSEIAERVT